MRPLIYLFIGAAVFGSGLAPAQVASPQSWTGLLVASTCAADTGSATGAADRVSDMTAKKTASEHETNTTYEQKVSQSDRNSATSSGESHTSSPTAVASNSSSKDQTFEQAQQTASQMPKSCRISSSTSAYALRSSDGQLVQFDDAGNTRIHDLLQSGGRLNHRSKIFRVTVKGTMSSGRIALDSINM